MLFRPGPRTHQENGAVRDAKAPGQGMREKVHLVKATVLMLQAVQGDRDDHVHGKELWIALDYSEELHGEIRAQRFEAFVLEEDYGVGQRPFINAETAGGLKRKSALRAVAAKRSGPAGLNSSGQDLTAKAADWRQNRLKRG
jgi:hypothetical protein